jgi:hypothetical protein
MVPHGLGLRSALPQNTCVDNSCSQAVCELHRWAHVWAKVRGRTLMGPRLGQDVGPYLGHIGPTCVPVMGP